MLTGASGVKVEHEEDSCGIALGVQAEKKLAKLERGTIACSGTDGHKMSK